MATRATERKLAAIMVVDVAGFSRLMERDESLTFARLRQLREEVTHRKIDEHGGRLIKTTGDGFLAEFPSATAALLCAIDLQRNVVAREAERSIETRIRLRIGINVGDIIIDGNDVAGDGVNIAARLEPLAPPDGICISASVREQIHDDLGIAFADLGEQKLKNITRPIRAFAVTLAGKAAAADTVSDSGMERSAGDLPSIAVLPFVNLSDEVGNEYFSDGLTEELLNVLAKIRGLRVASHTSVFHFKGKNVDLPTVARMLNVSTILEGSVRKSGKRVRIAAQLVQVATDSHLWSETYDRDMEDIFAVQDDIAQSVVKELRATLIGEHRDASRSARAKADVLVATRGRTEDVEVHRLYLEGRFFLERFSTEDIVKGLELLQRAVELDPTYALAWAALSRAYIVRSWGDVITRSPPAFELARAAAARALALQPDLPEGHAALGWVRMMADWDWTGADESFRRALALAPGHVDFVRYLSLLALNLGRTDEAREFHQRAVALDPLSAHAFGNLANYYLSAGSLDEAAAAVEKAIEFNPHRMITYFILAKVRLAQERPDDALAAFQRLGGVMRSLGITLAQFERGKRHESDEALRELTEKYADHNAFQIAEACAYRREADLAFQWLERAYKQHATELCQVKWDPLLRNLHEDPRWQAFLEKMGLAD